MKKLIGVFVLLVTIGCGESDFEVPAFEFSETVQSCGEYVLYRTNDDNTAVIAMSLSSTDLPQSAGEKNVVIEGNKSVIYRVFNSAIGSDYFCQSVPPSQPSVIKELQASGGSILISTEEILNASNELTGYKHTISISELQFDDNGDRIYFETFDFGIIETQI